MGWMMPDVKLEGRVITVRENSVWFEEQKEGFGGWTARRSEIRLTGASLLGTLSRKKVSKCKFMKECI